jgi:hypothetical protein
VPKENLKLKRKALAALAEFTKNSKVLPFVQVGGLNYLTRAQKENALDLESQTSNAKAIAHVASKSVTASYLLGQMGVVKPLLAMIELD